MSSPSGRDFFCVGIDHALALPRKEDPDLRPPGGFSMRGHSVGGFGSVTTNKVIATIAGNVFGKDVQAYPKYGSEKKGLPTTYYLTIADSHIHMHCELEQVDLLCVNDPTALLSPMTLHGLVPGGAIFMPVAVRRAGGRVEAHPGVESPVHPREQDSRVLLRHGEASPAKWHRRPTCKCACRASCCSAPSCG